MSRWMGAFLWAIVGGAAVAIAMCAAIMRSGSSTAAIGLLFIPFKVAPFAVLFLLFGYSLPDLVEFFQRTALPHSNWLKLRAALAALLAVGGIGYIAYGIIFTAIALNIQTMSEPQLRHFLDGSLWRRNRFALGVLAGNPNASAATLEEVVHFSDPALHDEMSSVWPVMGNNTRGLAVMRLIARHPNVSQNALVHLARSPDAYVRGDVALNPKTPVSTIRELALAPNQDLQIQIGLAHNANTPPDVLSELACSDSEYTRSAVARNPSTPIDTLEALARDPEPLVRGDVILNASTPVEAVADLSDDPDAGVRLRAKARMGIPR